MYENYTKQALPSKSYRELLGSALCVFNSNNTFIIENILRVDNNSQYKALRQNVWVKKVNKALAHQGFCYDS